MKILGLDFETTGLDTATCDVVEVCAVLVDDATVDKAGRQMQMVEKLSELVYSAHYKPLPPEITELTGITDKELMARGIAEEMALQRLLGLMAEAQLVVCHNVGFDKKVLYAWAKRLGKEVPERQWLCTLTEVPYEKKYKCRKLSHLALDHGITVHGDDLHRADYDVHLMLGVLLWFYDLPKVLAYAREPWVYLQARIPKPWDDGGAGKEQAKKLGFSWEKIHGDERVFEKLWVKRVKASEIEVIKTQAPFPVKEL